MLEKRMPLKQLAVRDQLLEKIRKGHCRYGERLPSGKELSTELGASYMTVSKALKSLEHDGFIECRHGVGNFVCFRTMPAYPEKRRVHLICTATPEEDKSIHASRFLTLGLEIFSRAGWEAQPHPVTGTLADARSIINDPEAYSVIFGFRPYWEHFRAGIEHVRNRVILIGERSENAGVCCVTSDEQQSIRLAMEHFWSQGLEQIGLICANLQSEIEQQRAAAWRSLSLQQGMNFEWCRDFYWDMELPAKMPTAAYVRRIVERMEESGRLRRLQALIAPDDDVAARFIGLAMDRGLKIPDDIAVVSIGNSALGELFRPQISSIDSNLPAHLETALGILENRIAGYPDPLRFHLCQPSLQVRASSRKITN